MATSRTGQSVTVGTPFAAPLAVTVTAGGTPVNGAQVTFTAPSSGASGRFANGTATETDTTDSNGVAKSSTFTANSTPGAYNVTATVSGAPTTAGFSLTNTTPLTTNYAFYLSGLEAICGSDYYYALAGSVSIDTSGNVVAGEQDYNDAFGCMSPEPAGDTISGGTLAVDGNGQGTLTLITSNTELGVSGTETLGVQFVNNNHALIIQFDGSATSSGSMDVQTLPSTPSGGYAFTLSGVDPNYEPVASGGVFSISGSSLTNGVLDVNDMGTVVTGTVFTGTLSTPDSFGRGTISGTGIANTLVYYIVGPEAIRIIDVDTTDSAVGSAFGQGSGVFTNASLGSSVFGVETNSEAVEYAVVGMFTVPASGAFQGIVDQNDQDLIWSGASISGNYSISNTVSGATYNGYGSLTITPGTSGYFRNLGIYLTAPSLNLNDPNNTTGGGGALVLALDPYFAGGAGVVTPQTDTAAASFAGKYAFGLQDLYMGNPGWEFDFVGQGSVAGGILTGTGLVNDPFEFFTDAWGTYTAVPFSGTATPDLANPGRYTVPLTITAAGSLVPFQTVIYQASGGQLFWVEEDAEATTPNLQVYSSVFSGSLQQQGSLTGLPAVRRAASKSQVRRKP
ncbi:MAG: hypothetical protein ACLQBK_24475 [Candidatus Sulfotelmatobacter sp.]